MPIARLPNHRSPDGSSSHKLAVVAYDGLRTFEYSIAMEVFGARRPAACTSWYEVVTVAGEPGPLRAHGGLRVDTHAGLAALAGARTIVVPGWRGPAQPVPEPLVQALRRAHRRGSRLVSICGGAFVLAAAGLLEGRRATTHWRHCEIFADRFPDVSLQPSVLYVDESDILTSAGSAAGLDLCLHIVRGDHGPDAANEVARGLVVPPLRSGSQAQFVQRPVQAQRASQLSPLMDWMQTALTEDLTIPRLSHKVNMSPRTFIRRFTEQTGVTPGEWVLGTRLERARVLLETTALAIDQVAARAGLGSAATLRHHFRARYRTTPTGHRAQFSRQTASPPSSL